MNCRDFEIEIQKLLDQRVDLDSPVLIYVHAERCEKCAQQLKLYKQVFARESVEKDTVAVAQRSSRWDLARFQQFSGALAGAVAVVLIVWISYLAESNTRKFDDVSRLTAKAPALKFVAPEAHSRQLADSPLADTEAAQRGPHDHPDLTRHPDPTRQGDLLSGIPNLAKLTPTVYQLPSKMPDPIQTLEPYYNYTSNLRIIRPWKNGIHCAVQMIQDSINDSEEQESPPPKNKTPQWNGRIWLGMLPVIC